MYIIGIDLGTTNCAVSFVDTSTPPFSIQSFRVPQMSDVGYVEELLTLPSFCYISAPNEFPEGSMKLPWKQSMKLIAGTFAKKYGGRVPTRLVQSAKSWLCHSGAHRKDPILPFNESSDEKISPVQTTTVYLNHIRESWNQRKAKGVPEAEFEQQEIVLTVPASFDEVARLLTVEAAKLAGYTNITLLEEPQSAFYAWIAENESYLDANMKTGDLILVLDVGGGTTDFSLIQVMDNAGKKTFQRMAVGDHLLLGGDNMDALIAHELEKKCPNITPLQRLQLNQEARNAKEALLGNEDVYKINLSGQGSHVISGSVSAVLTRQEIENWLMSGFFSSCSYEETGHLKKTSGIKSLGLPFEDEPSIVKQMGAFLHSAGDQMPDYILFNGGTMKPKMFQDAIVNTLNEWSSAKKSKVLPSVHLDLAVSKGAAYYGKVRKGLGVRILGGAARGYYLGVEVKEKKQAICCLPRGSDDGASYEPMQTFFIAPNTPVSFQLYTSHVRLDDKQGELIDISEEDFLKLPPIHTVLRFGKGMNLNQDKIPVHLKVTLTAIGTLEISLLSQISDHRWALEFQLKTASAIENSLGLLQGPRTDETFDANYLTVGKQAIIEAFSKSAKIPLNKLMEHLETVLGMARKEFSPSILRSLFDVLLEQAENRFFTTEHEERFFNLAGFFLRPGIGYPLDDFRVKNLWKIILSDSKITKSFQSRLQRFICYRRIAAGLTKGQQLQLKAELLPAMVSGKIEIKGRSETYEYSEKIRALSVFEYLEVPFKVKVGGSILERIQKRIALDADYFALGHLGARHLMYGKISDIIAVKTVEEWIEKLLKIKDIDEEKLGNLLCQLGRKTDLAEFNINSDLITRILKRFESSPLFEVLVKWLTTLEKLTVAEQGQVFGESLPIGLSLENIT